MVKLLTTRYPSLSYTSVGRRQKDEKHKFRPGSPPRNPSRRTRKHLRKRQKRNHREMRMGYTRSTTILRSHGSGTSMERAAPHHFTYLRHLQHRAHIGFVESHGNGHGHTL